jgi:hypothetical protein
MHIISCAVIAAFMFAARATRANYEERGRARYSSFGELATAGGDQAAVARDEVNCRSISLARPVASSTVSYADHSSVRLLQIISSVTESRMSAIHIAGSGRKRARTSR